MTSLATNTPQQPVCLPRTRQAKFLRALGVSPSSSQEELQAAADEFNRQFNFDATWESMPMLLAGAWGEISVCGNGNNGNNGKKCKPPLRRRLWLRR